MNEENTCVNEEMEQAVPEMPETEKADAKAKKKVKGDAAKLSAVEAKLADTEEKLAAKDEAFKRLAAEYDNFRKRSQKEHDTAFSNGVAHAAETLLPVLDTLGAAANVETADAEYKKGVLMTLAKAEEVFKKLGIAEIEAQGAAFNPELHNACMQEATDEVESGNIHKVFQKGYTLNGRVIRHSVVAVAE